MAIVTKKGLLQGKVSNIVYRNFRGRQVVQFKPSGIKQTVDTKEAALEFGLCSTTGMMIRRAFDKVSQGYDGTMINRMTSTVRRSFNTSSLPRCQRTLQDGELSLFQGFQFNVNSPVDKVLAQRPQAQLQEGQLSVSLPAVSFKDIKGIQAEAFRIRFLAISFDFRRRVYRYEGYQEIYINESQSYPGGSLQLSESLPPGRMILLSMSLHAYTGSIDGERMLNSVSWSPAELIGVWQTEAASEVPAVAQEPATLHPGLPSFYEDRRMQISRSSFQTKLNYIHSKDRRRRKLPAREASLGTVSTNTSGAWELPKGDVRF